MIQTGLISPAHDDLITDAAFDFYGTRLATCSYDQKYAFLPLELISESPRTRQGSKYGKELRMAPGIGHSNMNGRPTTRLFAQYRGHTQSLAQ